MAQGIVICPDRELVSLQPVTEFLSDAPPTLFGLKLLYSVMFSLQFRIWYCIHGYQGTFALRLNKVSGPGWNLG